MIGRGIARWALAGASVGAAVVAVAGCGSSSSVSNALDPVAQAATQSTSGPGFRMTMSLNLASSQLPSAITATGSGAFQTRNHVGSLSMAMSLGSLSSSPQVQQVFGGSTLNIAEVLDHGTIYMKLPSALTSKLPGGKPWLKLDLAKLGASSGLPGLGALANNPASSDPSQMLGYLRGTSGHLDNLGTADVGGVQTTHYRGTIDLNKVAARFPPSERQAIQQTINALKSQAGLSLIPVDVWVDNQHLVRRMQMAYNEQLAAVGQMHLSMTINIPDYGPQPAPAVPPASQVSDLSSLAGSASSSGL